jgi:hypothetical protein
MPSVAGAVTEIYRYPVKGLSAKKMDRVALMPGECLARSSFCHCSRFDTLRSAVPGMAAENTFHHADARPARRRDALRSRIAPSVLPENALDLSDGNPPKFGDEPVENGADARHSRGFERLPKKKRPRRA